MQEDIPFIKDETDYAEYRKLRPVKVYGKRKVKFMCSRCGHESVRAFKSLTSDFLCKSCVNSIAQSRPEVKEKIRATNMKTYGAKAPTCAPGVLAKACETNIKKLGVPWPTMSAEIRERQKKSLLEHYGVDNPTKSAEIREKVVTTVRERYSVDNVFQKEDFLISRRADNYENMENCLRRFELHFISKSDGSIRFRCNSCGKESEFSTAHFYRLLATASKSFCPHCSRIVSPHSSFGEKELLGHVKNIYTGTVIENDRSVLSPAELDIYLPELKLAFEYDGTYWHADPRFYESDFDIMGKPASEIWERDRKKEALCAERGIMLVRVKEYDWQVSGPTEKDRIEKIVAENLEKFGQGL